MAGIPNLAVGMNVRAAVLRKGQREIERLAQGLFPTIKPSTFASAAGIGDRILSCMVGRGQVIAPGHVMFVRH